MRSLYAKLIMFHINNQHAEQTQQAQQAKQIKQA